MTDRDDPTVAPPRSSAPAPARGALSTLLTSFWRARLASPAGPRARNPQPPTERRTQNPRATGGVLVAILRAESDPTRCGCPLCQWMRTRRPLCLVEPRPGAPIGIYELTEPAAVEFVALVERCAGSVPVGGPEPSARAAASGGRR